MESSSLSTICSYFVYSGAGNRFILSESCPTIGEIIALCRKTHTDGFLFIQPSSIADIRLIIFNDDGSRPAMCGNGLRCAIAHVAQVSSNDPILVETDSGLYSGRFYSWDRVIVDMTLPDFGLCKCILSEKIPGFSDSVVKVNTGVPHIVVFVDDISKINVDVYGKQFRYHPDFSPDGTNVNFVEIKSKRELYIRTYERGLERESAACGTGATAAAIAMAQQCNWNNVDITAITIENVRIKISMHNGGVYLEAPVQLERTFFFIP
ncbi:diaminopimelate epimerase [Chlamydia ibidis]|uniref:Diaminopimelate epimerase n=2 Tax=Chlamydia ibidis TaxID=1405396 RepID=S7J585_9CHLA|nr:bifunctional diaminopimelate epimerase/glutamate racemase [Chlamydia ibidis]EPP35378.1 diaminopimelate epimerase [Chlamydia ibidis]EQM63020.1 diaminopimelate epimerase [Chlamydia ibidis 10-1398/6]